MRYWPTATRTGAVTASGANRSKEHEGNHLRKPMLVAILVVGVGFHPLHINFSFASLSFDENVPHSDAVWQG